MGWLIGILIYITLVFLQIAWKYRWNINHYFKSKEYRPQQKEKQETEEDFY